VTDAAFPPGASSVRAKERALVHREPWVESFSRAVGAVVRRGREHVRMTASGANGDSLARAKIRETVIQTLDRKRSVETAATAAPELRPRSPHARLAVNFRWANGAPVPDQRAVALATSRPIQLTSAETALRCGWSPRAQARAPGWRATFAARLRATATPPAATNSKSPRPR